MNIFKKRETLLQNIAYMAIMAAINVIFVLFATYVPVMLFLIIFILPLSSTLVGCLCKKKYYPIYALCTIALCMLVTLNNISDTFFYVIPSVITGFIFALFLQLGISSAYIIITTSLILVGLSYAFIPLINFIYNINFINNMLSMFKLLDYKYVSYIVPATFLTMSLIQQTLSYLFTKSQLNKFGFCISEDTKFILPLIIEALILIIFFVFLFVYPPLTLFMFILFIYFALYIGSFIFVDIKKISLILLGVSVLLSIFIFAICYKRVSKPNSIYLFGIEFGFIIIISICNKYLFKNKINKDKIKEKE